MLWAEKNKNTIRKQSTIYAFLKQFLNLFFQFNCIQYSSNMLMYAKSEFSETQRAKDLARVQFKKVQPETISKFQVD